MHEAIRERFVLPAPTSRDALTDLLRQGAQRMLAQAIDAEVSEWIESHRDVRDEAGHRQVVRNGRLPKRTILSGVGPLEVEQSNSVSPVYLPCAGDPHSDSLL